MSLLYRSNTSVNTRAKQHQAFAERPRELRANGSHRSLPFELKTATLDTNATTAVEEEEEVDYVRTPWFERPCKGFKQIADLDALQDAITSGKDNQQLVVVEWFAGWCPSCKAAYPSLCKLPRERSLKEGVLFYKANIDTDKKLYRWLKEKRVPGLPYLAVFNPAGEQIAGMSSSFKKMREVKEYLLQAVEKMKLDTPAATP